jgi:ferrous iron transport protein A
VTENTVGILIEPLFWNMMAAKAATRKSGTSLDRVPPHSEIAIVALPGDADQARMLEQLGIREEARGHVRSAAPMGGPILLEIGGSAVAIARGVAKKIRVRVV